MTKHKRTVEQYKRRAVAVSHDSKDLQLLVESADGTYCEGRRLTPEEVEEKRQAGNVAFVKVDGRRRDHPAMVAVEEGTPCPQREKLGSEWERTAAGHPRYVEDRNIPFPAGKTIIHVRGTLGPREWRRQMILKQNSYISSYTGGGNSPQCKEKDTDSYGLRSR
jgi:hypothetical protein